MHDDSYVDAHNDTKQKCKHTLMYIYIYIYIYMYTCFQVQGGKVSSVLNHVYGLPPARLPVWCGASCYLSPIEPIPILEGGIA